MKLGKLPIDVLAGVLGNLPARDPRVIVGPKVGEDAAAIAFGETAVVAGMDPITFASDLIGWCAVQVNANDIAVMGARPKWFLATLMLPPNAERSLVSAIFDQLSRACDELDITLVGGHTEVTATVNQPVIVGCMLGEVARYGLVMTGGAKVGDDIIICGPVGVEGTALLAREAAEALAQAGLDQAAVEEARSFLFDPGIGIVRPALAAAAAGASSMHDPTEGGVASGLLEMARASGTGLEVNADSIPVRSLTREICRRLGLDPLGLIASGALLIASAPARTEAVLHSLRDAGTEGAVIGRVLPAEAGMSIISGGVRGPLPEFARDEVARFFETTEAGGRG